MMVCKLQFENHRPKGFSLNVGALLSGALGLLISFIEGQFDPSQSMISQLRSVIPRLFIRDDI